MKWIGLFIVAIGLFLGYSQFNKWYDIVLFKKNTVVVEGTVVEVKSNLEENNHWKNDEVELFVEFAYSSDSTARVADLCLAHSQNEKDYLSCSEVGSKKMVRFVPKEKRALSDQPDFIQITDDGDFYSSTFAWYLLLLPFPFLLIGAVFFWLGKRL